MLIQIKRNGEIVSEREYKLRAQHKETKEHMKEILQESIVRRGKRLFFLTHSSHFSNRNRETETSCYQGRNGTRCEARKSATAAARTLENGASYDLSRSSSSERAEGLSYKAIKYFETVQSSW